ncbi:GNAT superfamily N-acetyltransferase [Actinoalloteichus hoggarensis]|uniref:Acetyltransferase (GNAT) family protein n=1 Tax=Actinoalloteichus hoggarensis TaxID=1470176 RepID=A0A221VWC5_9PSEU|nr:GNAT family N-acetyltransferase [Actinoalloteichus hoggarensis]ASO17842.1 Acetyltransferase (GNAT) family protein [Actinoalloteichus hoggarensis]MBB5924254.1 GNAT superfamily N-acetyltransferase [Actinoalloteichus hoggarensis]
MRTRVLIRARRPEDLDGCVAMLGDTHRADGYPTRWPADPARWLRPPGPVLGSWVAVDSGAVGSLLGHVTLVAADEEIAGRAWLRHAGPAAARPAGISRLFVSPVARSRGVGTLLLDAACAQAGRHGLLPVLDVLDRDRAAVLFYLRYGFRQIDAVPMELNGVQETARCLALRT